MSADLTLPTDIAEYLRDAAKVLNTHKIEIDRLWDIWADEDPDPENGDFWHIVIDHPDADRMRKNLTKIADFLEWLAKFSYAEGLK